MRRQRTASQEAQPWHSTSAPTETRQSKVSQIQALAARGEPDKLTPAQRAGNFDEIYLPFRTEQAHREAARCLKCGEHSICEWTCPLHNHIPQCGLNALRPEISTARWNSHIRPTVYRKSLDVSVPRIVYAKVPARFVTNRAQSRSAILSVIFPTGRWQKAGDLI